MVNLTIDNINVSVPEDTTSWMRQNGWYPDSKALLSERYQRDAACRVCVVELEGMERAGNFLQPT